MTLLLVRIVLTADLPLRLPGPYACAGPMCITNNGPDPETALLADVHAAFDRAAHHFARSATSWRRAGHPVAFGRTPDTRTGERGMQWLRVDLRYCLSNHFPGELRFAAMREMVGNQRHQLHTKL